jgi:hypothetical protein
MRGIKTEHVMALQEDQDEFSFSECKYDEEEIEIEDAHQKKRVKRLLEDRLERKRLKDEFKDDFDELSGEFDWDELDK